MLSCLYFTFSDCRLFQWLANRLGKEWQQLATSLGFRSDEVERISMDHCYTYNRIFYLLDKWRRRQGPGADFIMDLQSALTECGRQDLAQIIQRRSGKLYIFQTVRYHI